jgi:hypothetical protein
MDGETEFTAEELASLYIEMRDKRKELANCYKAEDEEIGAAMDSLEREMLSMCNKIGSESIKTTCGTIIRSTRENYFCSDWGNFHKFVLENEAVALLEKRIHQGNFKEYMKDNPANGLPVGVSLNREHTITVRKPSSKE